MMDMEFKKLPPLNMDEEAEKFVENEDLCDYDWSGARRVHLEFSHPTEEVTLSLPVEVVSALKKKAEIPDLPYPKYIAQILEQAAVQL